jgi:antitoxin component HigA of HigAB toxin-antitoxin module
MLHATLCYAKIETRKQYDEAMAELRVLMDRDPDVNSPEGARLDALAFLVGQYEDAHFPVAKPTDAELAAFRREQRGDADNG